MSIASTGVILNAASALLGVAIEVILRDKYYQDLILKMREEGRTVPTLMELESAKLRVQDALDQLDSEIANQGG